MCIRDRGGISSSGTGGAGIYAAGDSVTVGDGAAAIGGAGNSVGRGILRKENGAEAVVPITDGRTGAVLTPVTAFFLEIRNGGEMCIRDRYGGAGSGKSVFAVQRFLVRMLQKELCNILAVRAVAATNRDSTYALFRQVIAKWGLGELFHCADSDLRITCANGNSVIFKGLDLSLIHI